jgi:hypothetical protein
VSGWRAIYPLHLMPDDLRARPPPQAAELEKEQAYDALDTYIYASVNLIPKTRSAPTTPSAAHWRPSMTKQHPITPPPELVALWQWLGNHFGSALLVQEISDVELALPTQAAQWGADQELEACCEWLSF